MPVILGPLAWAVLPGYPPPSRDHTRPSEPQIPLFILQRASTSEGWPRGQWVSLCLRQSHCQSDGGL